MFIVAEAVATTNPNTYSNYDAALYSAATMYVAQQSNKTNTGYVEYNFILLFVLPENCKVNAHHYNFGFFFL